MKEKKEKEEKKERAHRKRKQTQEKILKALSLNLGVVSKACRSLGIYQDVFYYHYRSDPDFAKKADAIKEEVVDFAESALHKKIAEGDTKAIIFFLKCKGKDRGYVETVNQNISLNDLNIELSID